MLGLRTTVRAAVAAVALACVAASTDARAAGSPFLEAADPAEAMASPAYRYASMTNEEAMAELDRRRILHVREAPTHGVRAPIRLTGRLHGVHVHSSLPPEQRPSTPFEILDARLALALDDFCAILARHDVDELVHYTMYRPNVPVAGWSPPASAAAPAKAGPKDDRKAGGSAKRRVDAPPGSKKSLGKGDKAPSKGSATGRGRARQKGFDLDEPLEAKEGFGDDALPEHDASDLGAKAAPSKAGPERPTASRGYGGGKRAVDKTSRRTAGALRRPPPRNAQEEEHTHRKWAPPGTRHPAGLAIDVGGVKKRDGRWLSIAGHFDGKIGQKTCGAGAPVPDSAEARELRAIVCEARAAGVFTYALTPNFDADHVDHVHFEIKPGVTWFLFH